MAIAAPFQSPLLPSLRGLFTSPRLPRSRRLASAPLFDAPSHDVAAQPAVTRPLRVLREVEPRRRGAAGRMVITGRLADVCAELERLAALEAGTRPAR